VGELSVSWGRTGSIVLSILFGVLCIPALFFGLRDLAWWVAIQVFGTLHLDYPYLRWGLIFSGVGVLQILCVRYGAWRTGKRRLLLVLCLIECLWSMIVIPNVIPYDMKTNEQVWEFARKLDEYGNANKTFPNREDLLSEFTASSSPYFEDGTNLPFRYVIIPNATGPFLSKPGNRPATIYYATSADLQDAWITATQLGSNHAVGHQIQFGPHTGGLQRFLHLQVGHWVVNDPI